MYERTMPASLVRNQLLKVKPTRGEVEAILSTIGPLAMVLREEDDQLRINGLRSKMPLGWEWGDDALARYHAAGLPIAMHKISIEGAICRWVKVRLAVIAKNLARPILVLGSQRSWALDPDAIPIAK